MIKKCDEIIDQLIELLNAPTDTESIKEEAIELLTTLKNEIHGKQ